MTARLGGTAARRPAGDRHVSGTPGRADLATAARGGRAGTIGAGYAGYALVRLAIHADRHAAFAHAGGLRVSWLGVAVAAEVVSLAGGAAAPRRLLSAADGSRQRWALAIGHADTLDGPLTVTFTRRRAAPRPPGHRGRTVGRRRHRALHRSPLHTPGGASALQLMPVTIRHRTELKINDNIEGEIPCPGAQSHA